MPQHENTDRARAERLFKTREQQKADAPKATADYYAAEQALRDRTQELKRLRLARDLQKNIRDKSVSEQSNERRRSTIPSSPAEAVRRRR